MSQVSGSSDLDFEREVKLDVYYIENWTAHARLHTSAQDLPHLPRGRRSSLLKDARRERAFQSFLFCAIIRVDQPNAYLMKARLIYVLPLLLLASLLCARPSHAAIDLIILGLPVSTILERNPAFRARASPHVWRFSSWSGAASITRRFQRQSGEPAAGQEMDHRCVGRGGRHPLLLCPARFPG